MQSPDGSVRVFIGLGSNVGDRLSYLQLAIDQLGKIPQTAVSSVSSVYETEPVGKKGQPDFLNAVAEVRSALEPQALLKELKSIEQRLGRKHRERWGPREIDLDMLYYDGRTVDEQDFQIPHPELYRRKFVLVPLAELAGMFRDPARNKSVAELLDQCPDPSAVRRTSHRILRSSGQKHPQEL